jgi:predicted phosphatase
MIMSSLYKTENRVDFNSNPIENSLIEEVLTKPDKMHMSYGDLAVNNWSTLLGVLKWSYENEGIKSIRVAEFCSTYKHNQDNQPRPFKTDI